MLVELRPQISEHEKPYIYFSTNQVVALFYTVKILEAPYNWFPYGFRSGIPIYTEYYPDALADVYKKLLEHEKNGELIIVRYENLSKNQKQWIDRTIKAEIKKYDLKNHPNCSYAKFIESNFLNSGKAKPS